jgi:rhodanese-related sulfurtransferase
MVRQHGQRFVQLVDAVRSRVKECTVEDVVQRRAEGDSFLLIDVREESEFAASRIPGAVHLSKGVIERDIEAAVPDTSAPIVLYCGGGYRSALAADNLQQMGYSNVISMDGGFRVWKDSGQPIDSSSPTPEAGG